MKTYTDLVAGEEAGLWPFPSEGERAAFMWGGLDEERLTHLDPNDAIEEQVERHLVEDGEDGGVQLWRDPETVEVAVYERQELPETFASADQVVRSIVEDLEEYGDPEKDVSDEMTPAMLEAAKVLLAVVREEYQVWNLDEVERFEVNVAEWRKATE